MNRQTPAAYAWRSCLAVVLLALVVRAGLSANLACLSRDGVHFVTFAKQLADDPVKWMQITTKQPGYSGLLLGVQRTVGPLLGGDEALNWERCGQLIALIGGVGACGLVFLLTHRLFGGTAAGVGGILAAFWWQGAQLSADVLSDMPHLALYLLALLIGYRAMTSRQLWTMAVCGLVAGAAYLLRQEALGLVGAVGICWAWPGLGMRIGRRLLGAALLVVGFVVVVAPYAFVVGEVMPNKGLDDLVRSAAPVSAMSGFGGGPWLLAHVIPWWEAPGRMAEAWARSGRYAISALVLLALFLRSAPRAEAVGRRLVLAAILLQVVLVQARVTAYAEISSRYMVIPLALSIPWAATGLITVLGLVMQRMRLAGGGRAVIVWVVGMLVPLGPQVYCLAWPVNDGRQQLRTAGRWLGEQAGPEDRIMARERLVQLMFYAGRTYPDETWLRVGETVAVEEVGRQIEAHDPMWFVDMEGGRAAVAAEPAYFESLLGGELARLELVQSLGVPGRRVFIFRVAKESGGPSLGRCS